MTKDELEQILNNCLNNAMIKSCRLKQPTNSNEIADFVSKWLVKNNDALPLVSGCSLNTYTLFLKTGDAILIKGRDISKAINVTPYESNDIQCWAFGNSLNEFYFDNEVKRWFEKECGE